MADEIHVPAAPASAEPAEAAAPRPEHAPTNGGLEALRERVLDVLRSCYDPEIPVNIYELGLVYDVDVTEGGAVSIRMTLTSPMCPVAGSLPPEVEEKVRGVEGVSDARVEVVWDPPWNPGMMSEAARLELNML
ncbi:MAG TPA: SUF system Fe-S cluster assembly protein [Myxococcota bacterium]|jgi:FeS assembly SUF system protein|nr:SUF system Fe-S cluster assembly protein [Myxococcota bacterium]